MGGELGHVCQAMGRGLARLLHRSQIEVLSWPLVAADVGYWQGSAALRRRDGRAQAPRSVAPVQEL